VYERNVIPLLEKISKINKLFERIIYANCIILAMPNNITIFDDTKLVIIVDNPLIDVTRGLPSMTQNPLTKFSKLWLFLGMGSK